MHYVIAILEKSTIPRADFSSKLVKFFHMDFQVCGPFVDDLLCHNCSDITFRQSLSEISPIVLPRSIDGGATETAGGAVVVAPSAEAPKVDVPRAELPRVEEPIANGLSASFLSAVPSFFSSGFGAPNRLRGAAGAVIVE
jgi:hypothetical protein